MSISLRFHPLKVVRLRQEAGDAVAITLAVPPASRALFAFQPGQFLTLRATVGGEDIRRSYSICSTPSQLDLQGEIEVGIRVVPEGLFSHWAATSVQVDDMLSVMPPDGRFVSHCPNAVHRLGFAAGSGITPILSIMRHSLETEERSHFSLVYGNRNMASVMFNETLQDLKDKYPDRVTLLHVLSRQTQEVELLQGRIDAHKVRMLLQSLLPAKSLDEVFVCGPEGMIDQTCQTLSQAGVPAHHIHSERFSSGSAAVTKPPTLANPADQSDPSATVKLTVILDGKPHELQMSPDAHILDVALSAGLDLPYSCRGGVCCTCRAKVMQGSVSMDKNFTLEKWETDQGFVLSCQAKPTSNQVTLSYDER